MGRLVNWLKVSFHVSKLAVGILFAYATLKWRVRKATGSFKKTLVQEGLPEDVVETLAKAYNESNRKVLGIVSDGLSNTNMLFDKGSEA